MKPSLLIAVLGCLWGTTQARVCNGMSGLCDLKFNEVSLACTHNSAANRVMYYFDGISSWPALDCFYRNQDYGFKDQLDYGIRFFDIDTKDKQGRPYASHGDALGTELKNEIRAITEWMDSNRNEVIGIRFENTQMSEFKKFKALFKDYGWIGDDRSGVRINKQGEWPTLGEAIDANERIFIFVHPDLCGEYCLSKNKWVHSNTQFDDSYQSRDVTFSCSGIVAETEAMCVGKTAPFQLVSIFASTGLCVKDMMGYCNPYIRDASMACYEERKKRGLTANWICADYVKHAGSNENVVVVADEINRLNIARFSKK